MRVGCSVVDEARGQGGSDSGQCLQFGCGGCIEVDARGMGVVFVARRERRGFTGDCDVNMLAVDEGAGEVDGGQVGTVECPARCGDGVCDT